ncbi:integrase catalytic domain-containing protein [Trichonephila clavipes]|nr:integrase catalytic domain-containing protein [Trichonephila clavipes]
MFKVDHGIIRLKTKIIYRKDSKDILRPIVFPPNHEVKKVLDSKWKKTVKHVVANCVICKRYVSKKEVISPPLTENRLRDAAVFQIVGIDMTGPLFLPENNKSWVLIFTCAVYRAVHFGLVTAASTDVFLMAFRRFFSHRGRCATVYWNNCTNFVGAVNYFKQLNWIQIQIYGAINNIEWKFNSPRAAWWGGEWEKLIRILKNPLKRVLGHARLNYEEMAKVLEDCERVIKSRPLTYICEEEAVKQFSLSMLMQDVHECNLTDLDAVEENYFCKRQIQISSA